MLDKLSVSLTGEELDVIEKLYYQAMKLEIDFFNAQPLFQPTIAPLTKGHNPEEDRLVIFSDFDLTCTVVDSSAILAEIAIVTAPKSDNQPEDQIARMLSSDLRNTWGSLSKQYTEEYEQCIESIMPANKCMMILCILSTMVLTALQRMCFAFILLICFDLCDLQWKILIIKNCLQHLGNFRNSRTQQIIGLLSQGFLRV